MRDDPIVEETRTARHELDAELGGDMAALWNYLKQIEDENAERIVDREPRPPFTTTR